MYKTLDDVRDKIQDAYDKGYARGYLLESEIFEEPFSVVLGTTLYIYGPPGSGKTQVLFEMLIQLSMKFDWRHAILSPETGDVDDIFIELIQMVAQKDITDTFGNQMSISDKQSIEAWVKDHFFVIETENQDGSTLKFREFYRIVDGIQTERGIEIHTTSIDPFDEVEVDWTKHARSDMVLRDELIWLRKNAKKTNRYNIIVLHLRDQKKIRRKIKGDDIEYYPSPDPQETMHGQEWYRRGMSMIGVWRPPSGLKFDHNDFFEDNSTIILFGKQKPKSVKQQGSSIRRIHWFWDDNRHRYYYKRYGECIYLQKFNNVSSKENRQGSPDFNLPEHL